MPLYAYSSNAIVAHWLWCMLVVRDSSCRLSHSNNYAPQLYGGGCSIWDTSGCAWCHSSCCCALDCGRHCAYVFVLRWCVVALLSMLTCCKHLLLWAHLVVMVQCAGRRWELCRRSWCCLSEHSGSRRRECTCHHTGPAHGMRQVHASLAC